MREARRLASATFAATIAAVGSSPEARATASATMRWAVGRSTRPSAGAGTGAVAIEIAAGAGSTISTRNSGPPGPPRVTMSPLVRGLRAMRAWLTKVPVAAPRSTTCQTPASSRISA